MPYTLNCLNCGKTFERGSNWVKSKKTFCSRKCYGEWQKNKSFEEQGKCREKRYCSITNCGNIHFGRGLCRKHYLGKYYPPTRIRENKYRKHCLYCHEEFVTNRKSAKYCCGECMGMHKRKAFIIKRGYKKILIPNHHRADGKGYVFEHIIIAESKLNRRLKDNEEMHHIDGNKLNNHPDNLIICKNHSEHMKLHHSP